MKLSKNEDNPIEWESKGYIPGKSSARQMPPNYVISKRFINLTLTNKFIMKINVCPYCKSHNTFHKRVQDTGDKIDNVWRIERHGKLKINNSYGCKKWDYCFNCEREFLIEFFGYVCTNRLKDFFIKLEKIIKYNLDKTNKFYKKHPEMLERLWKYD